MARFALPGSGWSVIQLLLPTKALAPAPCPAAQSIAGLNTS